MPNSFFKIDKSKVRCPYCGQEQWTYLIEVKCSSCGKMFHDEWLGGRTMPSNDFMLTPKEIINQWVETEHRLGFPSASWERGDEESILPHLIDSAKAQAIKLLEYQIALCSKGDMVDKGNSEATIGIKGLESMLVKSREA
jgi:ribosomal protein S27E